MWFLWEEYDEDPSLWVGDFTTAEELFSCDPWWEHVSKARGVVI